MPKGGATGQNLGHPIFLFIVFLLLSFSSVMSVIIQI